MGFFDRIFGADEPRRPAPNVPSPSPDAQALARYRYMVQTAPPETLEQAHEEAFAKLTPEQRTQVLRELVQVIPLNERAGVEATSSDDPKALARVATRAEIRQPGVMERTLGGSALGAGPSLIGSFAAAFVGSMVAQSFFSAMGGFGGEAHADAASEDATAANDEGASGDDGDGGFDGGDGGFDGGDFEV